MRICLALAAVVALGALCGALAVSFQSGRPGRPGRHSTGHPARVGPVAASQQASPGMPAGAPGYSLSTLDDASDLTFNRLLGINNLGHIAGYFGSGAAGHPPHGYIVRPPYSRAEYQSLSFPGSAQTQLTGLNDEGVQVGFWSARSAAGRPGGDAGCYLMGGRFHPVSFPARGSSRPPVNRLLGVNDHDIAVGFYADARGLAHGYRYDIATRRFTLVAVPGASSVVAAAINNSGTVAGFIATPSGGIAGFVLGPAGPPSVLSFPGATMTRALGVNDSGEVVGDYQIGTGRGASTHGFTWTARHGFTTIDGPDAAVSTTINGVNNAGDLVGYYVSRAGDTDGLLAMPGGSG